MMEEVFVELYLGFPPDHDHLKDRESVNPKLEQKVNFQLYPFFPRPIRIILINFRALSAATYN